MSRPFYVVRVKIMNYLHVMGGIPTTVYRVIKRPTVDGLFVFNFVSFVIGFCATVIDIINNIIMMYIPAFLILNTILYYHIES